MSTIPWRRWSADEIYNIKNEEQNIEEEEHLMFSFTPSSSQRFRIPKTSSSLSNIDETVIENKVCINSNNNIYLF